MNVFIRFGVNEVGLSIEASKDGKEWSFVELQKFREYSSPTVMQYSTCINIPRQMQDYLAHLRAKGVNYTVVKSEPALA